MISVCMAVYHGEKYIEEQISSVLPQLGAGDELIISDDAPGGETQRIAENLSSQDHRVKYFEGTGAGVVRNFENALSKASGDYIFLCDQDDVWLPEKVKKVMRELESGTALVIHDAKVTDGCLNEINASFFGEHGSKAGFLRNFAYNSYMGCCMAVRRELLSKALPFPKGIPMHDQWLGLIAERYFETKFLNESLILYRRHGGNVTGEKTGLTQKLSWRFSLLKALARKR
ncbi:MAG: glycosyltransferase family 2 protein [Clostridiales bacterium]|nr:glycosyltransferase family 2 protein [Clostridiales bacterium]